MAPSFKHSLTAMEKQHRHLLHQQQNPQSHQPPPRQDWSILSFIYNVLFLLGTLLVVFAAFRNTLTWWVTCSYTYMHRAPTIPSDRRWLHLPQPINHSGKWILNAFRKSNNCELSPLVHSFYCCCCCCQLNIQYGEILFLVIGLMLQND